MFWHDCRRAVGFVTVHIMLPSLSASKSCMQRIANSIVFFVRFLASRTICCAAPFVVFGRGMEEEEADAPPDEEDAAPLGPGPCKIDWKGSLAVAVQSASLVMTQP